MAEGGSPEIRPSIPVTQERVVNVLALTKEIRPLLNNKSSESKEQTRLFLKNIYPEANYDDFGDILDLRNANIGDKAKAKVYEMTDMVGAAALIAGGDEIYKWVADGAIGTNMARGMERLGEVVNDNLFVRDENDKVGALIVKKLRDCEAINVLVDRNLGLKKSKLYRERMDSIESDLSSALIEATMKNPNSEDSLKLGVVYGWICEQMGEVKEDVKVSGESTNIENTLYKLTNAIDKLTKPREKEPIDYDNVELGELNLRNLEIPTSPENQKKIVRKILDFVEAKPIFSLGNDISPYIEYLKMFQESAISDKNLIKEVKYTLVLNDIYFCLAAESGRVGESIGRDRQASIDYIANEMGEGAGINAELIDFMFRKHEAKDSYIQDFRVDSAWDLLQDVCFGYRKHIKEAFDAGYFDNVIEEKVLLGGDRDELKKKYLGVTTLIAPPFDSPSTPGQVRYNDLFGSYGEVTYNWFWDSEVTGRRDIMRNFMIDKLIKEQGLSKYEASKSIQLAEMMYYATGEVQYLNDDQVGEATKNKRMKIGEFRKIEYQKDKKHGPDSTLDGIESCDISYFRMIANRDKYGKDVIGLQDPIKVKDINSENTRGKYGYYLWGTTLAVNKFGVAYQAYMDTSFDLDKLVDKDGLATKLDAFNKLVEYIPNSLKYMSEISGTDKLAKKARKVENGTMARAWYVMGQMENGMKDNVRLDLLGLQKMYYHLVAKKEIPVVEDVEGRDVITGYTSFITDSLWDSIVEHLDVYRKLRVKAKLVKRFTGK